MTDVAQASHALPSVPYSPYGEQFSPAGFQTRVNASTFQVFKACQRKYAEEVLGGAQKDPNDVHLRFGTLLHEAKAVYEGNKAKGMGHELALQGGFRFLLHATWNAELDKPTFTEDPIKNRAGLLRTYVWFVEQYNGEDREDPCRTLMLPSGVPAVELKFEFDSGVIAPDGTPITFVGTIDRLVEFNGERYVSDIKTSTNARYLTVENYSPDGQFSLYALAAYVCYGIAVRGVILDGVEVGVNGTKCHRIIVPRTEAVLEQWLRDARVWLRRMCEAAERDEYPQNDAACGLYGGCRFRKKCSGRVETPTMHAVA